MRLAVARLVDDRVGPMVTRVFLVRHGEAAQVVPDADRPLTAQGRADVARLAAWCEAHGVAPHEILESGVLRATQTAEILAARLVPAGGSRRARGLAPHDDAGEWAQDLRHRTLPVMLVTHMPLVAELADLLDGRRSSGGFATSAIACFEGDGTALRQTAAWRPGDPVS